MNVYILAFAIALAVSFLATPWVRRFALRMNVMVSPGGRRVHTRPMPLWGGIAIYGAFVITAAIFMRLAGVSRAGETQILGVMVSGAILMIVGLIDDMKELSAATQSLSIVVAALALATFGVRIQFLTNPFVTGMQHINGIFHHPASHAEVARNLFTLHPVWSWVLTVMWIFLVTKTIDFMDGLDGLASGIGAIAAGVLGIMAFYSAQPHVALMAAALSGACVGFLRFNFNPAKIFMGTGGSQFIGFTLAALSIIGAFKVATTMAIALPVLVLGVPIIDGLRVLLKRLLQRQPMHIADRSHLHHHLLEKGLTQKQAVFVIWAITIACGCTALALWIHRYAGR